MHGAKKHKINTIIYKCFKYFEGQNCCQHI